jgi:hypothetical protein
VSANDVDCVGNVAGIIGGLLAYAFNGVSGAGGISGWQWYVRFQGLDPIHTNIEEALHCRGCRNDRNGNCRLDLPTRLYASSNPTVKQLNLTRIYLQSPLQRNGSPQPRRPSSKPVSPEALHAPQRRTLSLRKSFELSGTADSGSSPSAGPSRHAEAAVSSSTSLPLLRIWGLGTFPPWNPPPKPFANVRLSSQSDIATAQILNIPMSVLTIILIIITGYVADRARVPLPLFPIGATIIIIICYSVLVVYPNDIGVYIAMMIGNACSSTWFPYAPTLFSLCLTSH